MAEIRQQQQAAGGHEGPNELEQLRRRRHGPGEHGIKRLRGA